jgi:ankyrin repeat protein
MLLDAIRNGDADQVRSLLASDPSLYGSKTPEGASAVLWSVYTRHADLAPLLLGTREPDFFEACALGCVDRVIELIAEDAELVNAHAPDGFTGLGLACFFRQPEVAKALLAAGANACLASSNALRLAPLHSAVASDSVELVELLLANGADPSPRESSGGTPLHSAAGHGNTAIIELLLKAGADKEARTKDGKTPRDVAAQYGKAWTWG